MKTRKETLKEKLNFRRLQAAYMENFPYEYAEQKFRYDPETGLVFNKETKKAVGPIQKDGYAYVYFGAEKTVGLHKLAFLLMTKRWPKGHIDHKDNNPSNNKCDNLREVTIEQNAQNKKYVGRSNTGIVGVRQSNNNSYNAYISYKGKPINLGTYKTLIKAVIERYKAEIKYGYADIRKNSMAKDFIKYYLSINKTKDSSQCETPSVTPPTLE